MYNKEIYKLLNEIKWKKKLKKLKKLKKQPITGKKSIFLFNQNWDKKLVNV